MKAQQNKQLNQAAEGAEVAQLMACLKLNHNHAGKAVKTAVLLRELNGAGKHRFSARSIRKHIGDIRNGDLMAPGFIVSSVADGYWFSTDTAEMHRYLQQQLDRMSNQFANVEPLHKRMRDGGNKTVKAQISIF